MTATERTLPNELSTSFLNALSHLKSHVGYNTSDDSFYLQENKKSIVDYDYVENLFTDELTKTDLHYDMVGDEEFQRLLDFGIKALDGMSPEVEDAMEKVEMQDTEEEYEEEEDYEEEELEEDGDENPEDIHFEFITEIIEEVRANPEDTDDDYLMVRIKNGLRMKNLEINFIE
ncbi:MAG: hypothetical protein OEY33_07260 [Bdellovibrionales bacterium]|nr:hypothetical protein [Bdellovibrionales bacterium]